LPFEIHPWSEISDQFSDNLLLGNGASIAVDDRFKYRSLKEHAIENGLFRKDVQSLFDFFRTDDFELVLRIVWQSTNVNTALDIEDDKTEQAYRHVRDCLIDAVRDIHPEYGEVEDHLPSIASFMKGFKTIASLNYDLIVYWAMMYGNELRNGHRFKDCFPGKSFDDDWNRFREPYVNDRDSSLVFYPHGNLILARDKLENERKIASAGSGLLESILGKWARGSYVPLFVSEGTRGQKKKSIKTSFYLNTVCREVLPSFANSVVFYGWGAGEEDQHILEQIARSRPRKVAFSVRNDDQGSCNRLNELVKQVCGGDCEAFFYDRASAGCWNNA
jgi:hypothetical protein